MEGFYKHPYLKNTVCTFFDSVCPRAVRQKVIRLYSWLVKLQKTPALAGEVHQLLQEPLLLHSTAETQSKPIQKKRIANEAPIVLTSVNKQLSSELAISQIKCVQQKSELALKDTAGGYETKVN